MRLLSKRRKVRSKPSASSRHSPSASAMRLAMFGGDGSRVPEIRIGSIASSGEPAWPCGRKLARRSEEHTSELQSLMRISYAVFCLKKKNKTNKREARRLQDITNNPRTHQT